MDAIIYTSNAGTTKQYAEMLGEKIGLPVYELKKAEVSPGAEVIYLGWVMASEIKGYKDAVKKWNICAACGICMGATGSQITEIRERNKISDDVPVFTMQGGFDITKLHGVYKMMMNMMKKTAGKSLENKADKTPEEEQMLGMMQHGGNYVSEDNLSEFLTWYKNC